MLYSIVVIPPNTLSGFKESWKEIFSGDELEEEKQRLLLDASIYLIEENLAFLEIYLGDENVW